MATMHAIAVIQSTQDQRIAAALEQIQAVFPDIKLEAPEYVRQPELQKAYKDKAVADMLDKLVAAIGPQEMSAKAIETVPDAPKDEPRGDEPPANPTGPTERENDAPTGPRDATSGSGPTGPTGPMQPNPLQRERPQVVAPKGTERKGNRGNK